MLATIFYFFIAIFLLVLVHEYGHFQVARFCGVRVVRFSFGFGKVLAAFRDKKGTEFTFSLIPLGGYVKMLDESEGPVSLKDRPFAFNTQSVWVRIAIVLAGPLFNLIFACAAFWLTAVIGTYTLAPIVGPSVPHSIAAKAGFMPGDEILTFNSEPVSTWQAVQYALMPLLGTRAPIEVVVKEPNTARRRTLVLSLDKWLLTSAKTAPLESLGLTPLIPKLPAIVGEVLADSPSSRAGIQPLDEIIKLNDKPLTDWIELVGFVQKNPGHPLSLTIKRQGTIRTLSAVIGTKDAQGYLGLMSKTPTWPKGFLRHQKVAPLKAVGLAFKQTFDVTKSSFVLVGRLLSGKIALQTISGPVGIAIGAGESARSGLVVYLNFLALVSISLAVLNLLPIPMLDGGHLLYYALEIVFRRPVPESLKTIGAYIGIALLLSLMVIAFINDVANV